jgi:hypothetical protein
LLLSQENIGSHKKMSGSDDPSRTLIQHQPLDLLTAHCPVAILIVEDLLVIGRTARLLGALMRAAAAACRRITGRSARLGEREARRPNRKRNCQREGFNFRHCIISFRTPHRENASRNDKFHRDGSSKFHRSSFARESLNARRELMHELNGCY